MIRNLFFAALILGLSVNTVSAADEPVPRVGSRGECEEHCIAACPNVPVKKLICEKRCKRRCKQEYPSVLDKKR